MDGMVTLAILAVTALVSWQAFGNRRLLERLLLWPPAVERQRQYDRLLTHGFVHADWQHLLFNMITLYFFGRHVGAVHDDIGALASPVLPSAILWRSCRRTCGTGATRPPHLGARARLSAVLFAFILVRPGR